MKPDVLIVSGFAGSGKGTVFQEARKLFPLLRLSVSMTTRAPRPGEIDGVHYYFVSREEFLATLEEDGFLEHTEYCGNFYGTPKKKLMEMVAAGFVPVLEIETDGAEQVMAKLDSYASVFLSPPDFETLESRLRGRGTETEEAIAKRLSAAKEELFRIPLYDHLIVNYDGGVKAAAEAIAEIAQTGETKSSVLCPDQEAFIRNFLK